MIVDIHAHLPSPYLFMPDEGNREGLKPALERMYQAGLKAGIDKQVMLGIRGNDLLKEAAGYGPDWLIPFFHGSCTDRESPANLEKYVLQYGFKGMKIHQELPLWPLTGLLGGQALFEKAGELGVPVVIHSWHEEEGLETILPVMHSGYFPAAVMGELGRRYPETTFILAHAGGIWVKSFQAAQPYPNVGFDMCGFDPERGIVETAVEILGAERVYFGSDVPGRSYSAQIAKVLYADISEADRQLILGGNAARLLDLR